MTDVTPCTTCSATARHEHHLTGRGSDGAQLDPEMTVPLCNDCHDLIHDHLRLEKIDRPLQATTIPERVERSLRRVAIFLSEFAQGNPAFVWAILLACKFDQWANLLRQHVEFLDAHHRDWRKGVIANG